MNNYAICTFAYNCGEIAAKALETFHQHHNEKVIVFATIKDFKKIPRHPNTIFYDLTTDLTLKQFYQQGHLGTAYIWTNILNGTFIKEQYIIHFDSDVIFFENCIDEIKKSLEDGYDLVGPRRSYEKTSSVVNVSGQGLPDLISTYLFGINKKTITPRNNETLIRMCAGYYSPHNFTIIDFFDPISFDVLQNGGKIQYLNFNEYGSTDEFGSKDNAFSFLNNNMDFGSKVAHFGGIGSGYHFLKQINTSVPQTYVKWAIERYAIYQEFLDKPVEPPIEISENNKIFLKELKAWKEKIPS